MQRCPCVYAPRHTLLDGGQFTRSAGKERPPPSRLLSRRLCSPHTRSGHSGGKEKYTFSYQDTNPCRLSLGPSQACITHQAL
jgi:hypothetical protein